MPVFLCGRVCFYVLVVHLKLSLHSAGYFYCTQPLQEFTIFSMQEKMGVLQLVT